MDGNGNALSETEIGTSVDVEWNRLRHWIAPNVNDAVEGTGQTIDADAGQLFQHLVAGRRHQRQPTEPAIHDQLHRRHVDDRNAKHQRLGIAARLCRRVGRAGDALSQHSPAAARSTGTFDVYGYSIAVDPTKTVESITLPNNGNVKVLSMVAQATLDAPTNLAAAAAVNGNVTLTWTASDSTVTGYDVYRYTVGNAASPTLLSSGVTATNYTDTTSLAGNTYYYVVKAVNGSAVSPASNVASATSANTATTTEVDLNWRVQPGGHHGRRRRVSRAAWTARATP